MQRSRAASKKSKAVNQKSRCRRPATPWKPAATGEGALPTYFYAY